MSQCGACHAVSVWASAAVAGEHQATFDLGGGRTCASDAVSQSGTGSNTVCDAASNLYLWLEAWRRSEFTSHDEAEGMASENELAQQGSSGKLFRSL